MSILSFLDRNQTEKHEKGMNEMAKHLTGRNFEEEVLKADSGESVLVDFWAPWCGPCKMQGPIVEKMAEEGFNVGKVNIDEELELASKYQVMSIPTLLVFKDGKEVERLVGLHPRQAIERVMR